MYVLEVGVCSIFAYLRINDRNHHLLDLHIWETLTNIWKPEQRELNLNWTRSTSSVINFIIHVFQCVIAVYSIPPVCYIDCLCDSNALLAVENKYRLSRLVNI